MEEALSVFWKELLARPSGPLAFRFIIQPLMACFFAVRDGRHDARAGKPAYFWALFTDKAQRSELLRSGWKSIGRLLIFAAAMDVIYQLMVLKTIRPTETIVVALCLAALPYTLLRGPVNRLSRRAGRKSKAG